jgi:hypothetical protein
MCSSINRRGPIKIREIANLFWLKSGFWEKRKKRNDLSDEEKILSVEKLEKWLM